MFHALSGRLPFEAASAPALLYAILEQTPPELSSMRGDVAPGLSQIIARAMSKHPSARFGSADEMRAAIEPFAAATPGAAPSVSMAPAIAPSMAPAHPSTGQRMSFDATVAARAVPPAARSGVPTWVWVVGGLSVLAVLGVIVAAGGAAFFLTRSASAPAVVSSSAPVSTAGAIAPVTTSTEVVAEKVAPRASATVATAKAVAPTTTGATTGTGSGSGSGNNLDAGGAVSSAKPTGRKTAHLNSMQAGNLFTIEQVRGAVDSVQPQVNACYAASEMDPVDHQFTMWMLITKPNGDIASVGSIPGATAERSPRLDACMGRVLGGLHLGAPSKPEQSEVRVGFESELPWKK
jgi:hypothetical protein